MNTKRLMPAIILLLSSASFERSALAQGTAFSYQGRLQSSGSSANGLYDFRFRLFVDPLGNNQAGSAVLTNSVAVSNGLFMVTLDFGSGTFNGSNYWLEVDVRTNGSGAYTDLAPLQGITPAPYAIFAENAAVSSLTAGTYTNAVTLNNPANGFTGTFTGNGAGLTNVSAATVGGLTSANFWQTAGNIGTSPTNGNFLGTMDNQPLELRADNSRVLRIEPGGTNAPNVIWGHPANWVMSGAVGAVIGGGGGSSVTTGALLTNIVTDSHSVVGGGLGNIAGDNDGDPTSARYATVGGGVQNQAAARAATVAGGDSNFIGTNAGSSSIGGGSGNGIEAITYDANLGGYNSVIAGGLGNSINSPYDIIGGGSYHSIGTNSNSGTVGGGYFNTIGNNTFDSTIGGGSYHSIGTNSFGSTISGGSGNSIEANSASGTVSGGYNNTIQTNAPYATISGGYFNVAAGPNSFAAGTYAEAMHDGAFVWADNEGTPFASSATNQFSVRANGGVQFATAGAGMTVDGHGVVPSGNYVFASGGLQTVAAANVFQDVTFSTDIQIDGWMHTPGTSEYTNSQAGLFLIQYSVQADSATLTGTNVQAQVALNSLAVGGSRSAVSFNALTQIGAVSRSIIASVNNSDVLTLQFTGSSTSVRLAGSPGVTLTITRIQ